jgi:CRP-like cAMP-binding protein
MSSLFCYQEISSRNPSNIWLFCTPVSSQLMLLSFPPQGFDDQCLGVIASHLRPASFAIGEIIYEHGDRSNEMFFVLDGTVVVHANGPCALKAQDPPGEADKVVGEGIVTQGDVFGEAGLFPTELGPWRRESVSALTWVSAYTLNAAALRDISAEYPEVQPNPAPI